MEQISIDGLSPEAMDTYRSVRKSMYLILARMHDMGMNPDVEKVQQNEVLSVNTFMLGQAIIGNHSQLSQKNPIENVKAIEDAYRLTMERFPLSQEIINFMTTESQLGFMLFLCGGAQVWFEKKAES